MELVEYRVKLCLSTKLIRLCYFYNYIHGLLYQMIKMVILKGVKCFLYIVSFLNVNSRSWCFKIYNFWTQHYIDYDPNLFLVVSSNCFYWNLFLLCTFLIKFYFRCVYVSIKTILESKIKSNKFIAQN